MAGFRGLLAFWVGGAATGEPTDATTAVASYPVKSQGRGRKRRHYIELDGRRLYGSYADLRRILDARTKPPLVARAVPPSGPQPAPAPVAPAAAPLPALQPIDLTAYRTAKALAEAEQQRLENAAIALLLMS